MKVSQIRRLEKLEKAAKVGEVDIAAILIQGREDSRKGIKRIPQPLTPELMEEMKSTHTGRVLLAARLRVGWYA